MTLVAFAVVALGSLALIPVVGRDFFPYVDSGQMEFHVQAAGGHADRNCKGGIQASNEDAACDPGGAAADGGKQHRAAAAGQGEPQAPLPELIKGAWERRQERVRRDEFGRPARCSGKRLEIKKCSAGSPAVGLVERSSG